MPWRTMLVGTALLIILNNFVATSEPHTEEPEFSLPPLREELVELRWVKEGEEAPFDGLLMNSYTYERMRLKMIEGGN